MKRTKIRGGAVGASPNYFTAFAESAQKAGGFMAAASQGKQGNSLQAERADLKKIFDFYLTNLQKYGLSIV